MSKEKIRIKNLKDRIAYLERELASVKEDRDKFRSDYAHNLREAIRIHGLGNYWSMSNLIETFSKQMRNKQWWYW